MSLRGHNALFQLDLSKLAPKGHEWEELEIIQDLYNMHQWWKRQNRVSGPFKLANELVFSTNYRFSQSE
jgi:hypothetical protein